MTNPTSQPPAIRRRLGRVFEIVTTDLLVRDLAKPLREPRARVPVEVTPVAEEGALPPARRRRARPFLARGDVGHLAMVEGAFAGEVWVSRCSHRDPYSGLRLRLAPDEAYAYALHVEPEFRPKGVAVVLMTAMLRGLQDDPGLTRVYGWVDRRNRESQLLLRLLGFTRAQEVRRAHLLHRVGRPVPLTAEPAFGPLSRDGRHRQRPPVSE